MSVLVGAVVVAAGKPQALVLAGTFAGMALASFGANAFRQPRWARERERQMEELAEHAVRLLSRFVERAMSKRGISNFGVTSQN